MSAINRGLAQLHHRGTIAFGQPDLGRVKENREILRSTVAEGTKEYNKWIQDKSYAELDKKKGSFFGASSASSNQGCLDCMQICLG